MKGDTSQSVKIFPCIVVIKRVGVYENSNIFFSNVLVGSIPLETNRKFCLNCSRNSPPFVQPEVSFYLQMSLSAP